MLYIKRNVILYIVASFMIVFNIYLLYKKEVDKRNLHCAINDVKVVRDNVLSLYKLNFDVSILNNGIYLDNLSIVDKNNIGIKLKELFRNKGKLLVCRFSELNCQECVVYSIVKMINYSDSIKNDNIIFLGHYENNKNLNMIKKQIGIKDIATYNCSYMSTPMEELSSPYYFIVDSTLIMSDIFVPDKSFPSLTNHYLNMIKRKYFQQDKKRSIQSINVN